MTRFSALVAVLITLLLVVPFGGAASLEHGNETVEESDFLEHLLEMYDSNNDNKLTEHEFEEWFDDLFPNPHAHGHDDEEHDEHDDEEHDEHDDHEEHDEEHGDEDEDHGDEDEDHDDEDGHADHDEHGDHDHDENCLPEEELFEEYDQNHDGFLNGSEIVDVGFTLSFMKAINCDFNKEESCEADMLEAWLLGLVSSILTALISLVGIVCIPFQKAGFQDAVLVPMIAFAIGTLLGDAIFHLIPAALQVHTHGEVEEEEDENAYLLPMGLVVLGILLFFLVERQVQLHHHHDPDREHHVEMKSMDGSEGKEDAEDVADEDHGAVIQPFAYLSLISESLHNFIDGIAIGASYSQSLSTGFATTVAVTFHEVPQELGDFAILIRAGFSKGKAILLNFLSALTSILGTVIGLAVGSAARDADRYILALTAGGFLYISLADMVVELHKSKGVRQTAYQTMAMILGFVIMILIALFAEPESECH